ncbi:phage tail protein [Streptomyces malaysiensis]|uniref:Phage tail protein n=1 Tax=Streptomyces malaysiensis subsp. samsunensis TaxID=459658 RepID=A0A9X2M1N1_STRMQ|nr:phage tail protein [Streptomyces samsunensis]MCQ8831754.1 phage tail protein [Streptomyces samsunensis]
MSFLVASGHVQVDARTEKAEAAILGVIGALGAVGPAAAVAGAGIAAAGTSLAAFGAAVIPQISKMSDAVKAQGKYKDAVEKSGKSSQEAAKAENEYQQTLSKMPQATREATAAFVSLKDSYKAWSDSLADDTMKPVTHSLQLFQALLPKMSPLVKTASTELDRFVTLIAGGVASPGFDAFMVKVDSFAQKSLRFMLDGIVHLGEKLASFAAGGGFDDFMTRAREMGPLIAETLGNIAKAALHLVDSGGDLGVTLLTVANGLAKLVNAVPSGVISNFLQLYAAFKLARLGAAALTAVTTSAAATNLANFVRAARFGGLSGALSGAVQNMTRMQKVAAGLGILGGVAYGISKLAEKARGAPPDVDKLTTSLKNLASSGQFTGELQKTFGNMDGLIAKVKELDKATEASKKNVLGIKVPVLDDVAHWVSGKVDDLVMGGKSLKALQEDFESLDKSMAQMVSSGNAEQAASGFDRIKKAMSDAGYSTKEINKLFPEYKASVAALKADQQLAAQGMGLFGQQAMSTKAKLDEQKRSTDGLRQSIVALNEVNRAGLGGMIGFEQAIDDAAKAAKTNADSLRMVHGELDLNSQKARDASTALQDLATKTDDAATKARESGQSWESVNAIYSRGREKLIDFAIQMGLSSTEANRLASQILKIPDSHKTKIEMQREDAIAGLNAVISKIKATPGSKSITVKSLTNSAIAALEAVGFKVKRLPDGSVKVTALTGTALANLAAVKRARDGLQNRTITITTMYRQVGKPPGHAGPGGIPANARGGLLRGYASGGHVDMQAFPGGGLIQGPGTGTSDSILGLFANGPARVSNAEYVVRAAAVAKYGVGFMDAVNAGRLPRFAKGGLTEKQKEAARKQAEARSSLRGAVTLGNMSTIAGWVNPEIRGMLAKPADESALISSLYSLQTKIKGSFAGATETRLLNQLTRSASSLFKLRDSAEANSKALDSAKDKLNDLKGQFDSLKTSVKSSLVGFGNITKIGKYGTSASTLINQLKSDTTRTGDFAKQLDELKKRGLNAQMISDIAAAGVTGGGMATAQSLLTATPEQIAQINALQAQLVSSADKAGTTVADSMYGAGIKAADGLVKGLTEKQKAIEAQMMTIAKSMERAIKSALGIRSPSRVMAKLGQHTVDGFNQGLTSRKSLITTPGTMRLVTPSSPPQAWQNAAAMTTIQNLNVTVSGSFDMASPAERRRVAEALAAEVSEALRNRDKERRR